MATFTYIAKNKEGNEISGTEEFGNQFDLANSLRARGYILVSYREKKDKSEARGSSFSFIIFGGVSLIDKMMFARNLSEMIGAGVSLTRSLEIFSRQTTSKAFRKILEDMINGIREGKSLSDTMSGYPRVFSNFFRAMVRAGEASGTLEESLRLVSRQLESDHELKRKIRGAFMYPVIILIAMFAIGILMMVYVVPTLTSVFSELGVELPQTTRIVISISNFVMTRTILAISIMAGIILLCVGFFQSIAGRAVVGEFLLRIPVLSGLTKKLNSARTARTLGSLIGGGVSVIDALEITEGVVGHRNFKKVLNRARTEIQKGNPVSAAFIQSAPLYPLLVGEMMQVGEETGKLPEMLFRLAEFYEEEVAAATKDIATIIEPVLMIIIGIIVGFFAISMITPLYSSLGNI